MQVQAKQILSSKLVIGELQDMNTHILYATVKVKLDEFPTYEFVVVERESIRPV